jgi:hypothetical protein
MRHILAGLAVAAALFAAPAYAQLDDTGSELESAPGAAATEKILKDLFGVTQVVDYAVVGTDAMFDGDMSIGEHQIVQRESIELVFELIAEADLAALDGDDETQDLVKQMQELLAGRPRAAVGLNIQAWPGSKIPYEVMSDITDQTLLTRIDDAIAYWNSEAPVKLVERTNEGDFLRIRDADGSGWNCSAQVGYRLGYGGHLNLNAPCPVGTIVHEMLHVAGIMHEHQRANRDTFVTMAPWASSGSNLGKRTVSWGTNYDMCSISHYSPDIVVPGHQGEKAYTPTSEGATNLAACKATLKPQCRNQAPGQRCQLSGRDIEALGHLY